MSKPSKTPKITETTKILSFDLETNGLHGKAFAVGGVIMDGLGVVHDEFTARSRLTEKVDDWVKKNVLPAIEDMPIDHDNHEQLRESFWGWFVKAQDESDYVLVNNGYPVEHRFLLECQDANLEERYWQHPFPVLELSSLLLMIEHSGGSSKGALKKSVDSEYGRKLHHPLEDAKLAVKMAFEAFRQIDRIK